MSNELAAKVYKAGRVGYKAQSLPEAEKLREMGFINSDRHQAGRWYAPGYQPPVGGWGQVGPSGIAKGPVAGR